MTTLGNILGLGADGFNNDLTAAFDDYRTKLETQIASAPTPALKAKLRKKLKDAEAAYDAHMAGDVEEDLPSVDKSGVGASQAEPRQSSDRGQTRAKLPYHFQGQKLLTTEALATAFHTDWQAGLAEYNSGKLGKWIKEQLSDPHFAEQLAEIEALKGLSPELDLKAQRFSLVLLLLDPNRDVVFEGAKVGPGNIPDETLFLLLAVIDRNKETLVPSTFPTLVRQISGNGDLQARAQKLFQSGTASYVPLLLASAEHEHTTEFVRVSLGVDQALSKKWAFASETFNAFATQFTTPWKIASKEDVAEFALSHCTQAAWREAERRATEKLRKTYVDASSPQLKPIFGASHLDRAQVIAVEVGRGWLTPENTKAKQEKATKNRKMLVGAAIVCAIIGSAFFVNYQQEQSRLEQLRIERADRETARKQKNLRLNEQLSDLLSERQRQDETLRKYQSEMESKQSLLTIAVEADRRASRSAQDCVGRYNAATYKRSYCQSTFDRAEAARSKKKNLERELAALSERLTSFRNGEFHSLSLKIRKLRRELQAN